MPDYQTKLKVGRKLEGVDTDTASDNRLSALLRFDEDGNEDHVSISIESDAMGPEDVFAVFDLLDERGVLTAADCKTWLHQSKASKDVYGETSEWQGTNVSEKVTMLKRGVRVRTGPSDGPDAEARNKQALLRVGEAQDRLEDVRRTLKGEALDGDEDEAGDGSLV